MWGKGGPSRGLLDLSRAVDKSLGEVSSFKEEAKLCLGQDDVVFLVGINLSE